MNKLTHILYLLTIFSSVYIQAGAKIVYEITFSHLANIYAAREMWKKIIKSAGKKPLLPRK